MNQVIIYPQNNNSVAVVYPTGELPVLEVARKDVPANKPYKVLDAINLPEDHTFFNAWEGDFSQPDGYGIGQQAWFIEQYNAEINAINAEQAPARLPDDQQTIEEYDAVVAQWEQSKAARIEQLNKMIAVQEAEMAA
jgi:hypothetical protein